MRKVQVYQFRPGAAIELGEEEEEAEEEGKVLPVRKGEKNH